MGHFRRVPRNSCLGRQSLNGGFRAEPPVPGAREADDFFHPLMASIRRIRLVGGRNDVNARSAVGRRW